MGEGECKTQSNMKRGTAFDNEGLQVLSRQMRKQTAFGLKRGLRVHWGNGGGGGQVVGGWGWAC